MTIEDINRIARLRNEAWNKGFTAACNGEPVAHKPAFPLSWQAGYDHAKANGLFGSTRKEEAEG